MVGCLTLRWEESFGSGKVVERMATSKPRDKRILEKETAIRER